MLFVKLIADTPDDVSTAFFDQYSIAHFIGGIILYLSLLLIYKFSRKGRERYRPALFYGFLLLSVVLIFLFEIIENNFFLPFKPNQRKDSIENMSTDIILSTIGAYIVHYITKRYYTRVRYVTTYKINTPQYNQPRNVRLNRSVQNNNRFSRFRRQERQNA